MTSEEYKELSLREFDRAAEKFDDNDPSVYNVRRKWSSAGALRNTKGLPAALRRLKSPCIDKTKSRNDTFFGSVPAFIASTINLSKKLFL